MSRIAAECARWDTILANLSNARAQAEGLLAGPVNGAELGALARYQVYVEQQRKIAIDRRREAAIKMEQQRARVLQARRECRLLERLRQVRRAEWESAVNHEFEALATETYLAQWEPPHRRES